ncbi:hypothetical protein [Sphingobacterium sp. UBA6645]|uniref:hypothetical protein n=1 Tax=Sphingobacterium sp. UBA6645 TaxID=1947511 RepID=UPI0025FE9F45|nr:hypothetical protein [Sphingobacterium sp. UBA6645]
MIPESLPISDGTTVYDFRKPVNIAASNYATNMDLSSAHWENGVAPVRNVDGLSNGTTLDLRFNKAIVPTIGASKDRNEDVGRAFYLASTRKTYPIVMDDKVKRTYPVGDGI